jgi:hypothetical protein
VGRQWRGDDDDRRLRRRVVVIMNALLLALALTSTPPGVVSPSLRFDSPIRACSDGDNAAAWSWNDDRGTGVAHSAAGRFDLCARGVRAARISSSGIELPNGSTSAYALRFIDEPTRGLSYDDALFAGVELLTLHGGDRPIGIDATGLYSSAGINVLAAGNGTVPFIIFDASNAGRVFQINPTGSFSTHETASASAASGDAVLYADAATHTLRLSLNGGAFSDVATAATAFAVANSANNRVVVASGAGSARATSHLTYPTDESTSHDLVIDGTDDLGANLQVGGAGHAVAVKVYEAPAFFGASGAWLGITDSAGNVCSTGRASSDQGDACLVAKRATVGGSLWLLDSNARGLMIDRLTDNVVIDRAIKGTSAVTDATTGSCTVASVAGNSIDFTFTVTCTAAQTFVASFANDLGAAPRCVVGAANAAAGGTTGTAYQSGGTSTTATFTIPAVTTGKYNVTCAL